MKTAVSSGIALPYRQTTNTHECPTIICNTAPANGVLTPSHFRLFDGIPFPSDRGGACQSSHAEIYGRGPRRNEWELASSWRTLNQMRGFEFDFVMQRARQVQAAEGFGGFRQLGEAGEDWFGGVHRLRVSSHRLSQHFGMFECDGDQHAGRAGWFALFLFPTAEGAESDTEEIGEGFLREV